ncbi:MAG: GrpB family protein [Lachnospiraceae bacterium]|nr:GrpB family protein [Lachnospiraceae bacterium]
MGKKLSEMSLEELWQLFPIILTEHKPYWSEWYVEEAAILQEVLPTDQVVCISHIGSTAIEGICAKPIIDILVEITGDGDFQAFKKCLIDSGYLCMSENEKRLSFNKGYTEEGFAERVFHLHLRRAGDNDELYFRDYLIAHPDAAKEYEKLKLGLWKLYEHDRDGYTGAKAEFVKEYTSKAKDSIPKAIIHQ